MKVNRLVWLCIIAISGLCVACDRIEVEDNPIKQDGTDVLYFALQGVDGLEYNSSYMNDSTIHVVLPNQFDCSNLTPIVHHNARYAIIDGMDLSGGDKIDLSDFMNPLSLTLESSLGEKKTYRLIVHDLPVVLIDTPDNRPIDSKTERVEGCVVRLAEAPGIIDTLGRAGIRGRGSSSWNLPKKPYNIKFEGKTSILGMPKSKHWVLLANAYFDRTQLHNATAFEMARLTDYPWVQDGRFVELILNGEHKGLYYLCEKVGEEKGKIELGDEDFLLESYVVLKSVSEEYQYPENYFETKYFNETGIDPFVCTLGWETKYPEDPNYEKRNQIKGWLEATEELIFNDEKLKNGLYRERFDIETAINWYLVQECTLNEEASRTKNVYLYTMGGALYVGPPWDFDAWTFGIRGKKQYSCRYSSLYYPQLLKDPVFVQRLKEKWGMYKQIWENHIPEFIDNQYNAICRSAERNEMMWPDWHPVNSYGTKTYQELIDDMKQSLIEQLEWLDNEIRSF